MITIVPVRLIDKGIVEEICEDERRDFGQGL